MLALLRPSLLLITLALGCGDDGGGASDAALDAIRQLAVTVEGTGTTTATRSVTVTITVTNNTRMEMFPVGGLPATVEMDAPIQLSDWTIRVDGFDTSGTMVGRGMVTIPSGTAATTVTLAPI